MSAAPDYDDEPPRRARQVSSPALEAGADPAALGEGVADGPRGDHPESAQVPTGTRFDPRARAAWQSWLSALATDAEAALAAALAYDSLDAEGRDAWLDVLEQDAPSLAVPALALYAPLLSVETDEGRRARMLASIAPARLERARSHEVCAYRAVRPDGSHLAVVVAPVYLDFVEVLTCNYLRDGGVVSAQRDPLRHVDAVTEILHEGDSGLEPTPLAVVVDELAHAILADRRDGRASPEALGAFAHLFGPDLERWGDGEA